MNSKESVKRSNYEKAGFGVRLAFAVFLAFLTVLFFIGVLSFSSYTDSTTLFGGLAEELKSAGFEGLSLIAVWYAPTHICFLQMLLFLGFTVPAFISVFVGKKLYIVDMAIGGAMIVFSFAVSTVAACNGDGSAFFFFLIMSAVAVLGIVCGILRIKEDKWRKKENAAEEAAAAQRRENEQFAASGEKSTKTVIKSDKDAWRSKYRADYENKPFVSRFLDRYNEEDIVYEGDSGKTVFRRLFVTPYDGRLYALAEVVLTDGMQSDDRALLYIDYDNDLIQFVDDEEIRAEIEKLYKEETSEGQAIAE